MTKKRLTKVEIALRQELANAIHDMDDGKLESSRLHNLIGRINNKLYHNEEDCDIEEEEKEILPSLCENWEYYTDEIEYVDLESFYDDNDTSGIYNALEELSYSTDAKKVPKRLKKVETEFGKYIKTVKGLDKEVASEIKSCIASAEKQLKKIKAAVAKDLKPKKSKGKKSADKTLL